jgi:Trk K+ transport system NAD-binding subunit
MNSSPTAAGPAGHIVICGLGHVGVDIARLLLRLGERIVLVTNATAEGTAAFVGLEYQVVHGDAREEHVLRQAGVRAARAVVIVTHTDLVNVTVAFAARRLNPGIRVIARLFDQDLAAHLEECGVVDHAMSTSALAAPAFVASALGRAAHGAITLGESACLLEDAAVEAGSPWIGRPATQWAAANSASLIARWRPGVDTTAGPETAFADSAPLVAGDVLTWLRVDEPGMARGRGRRKSKPLWKQVLDETRGWWGQTPRTLRLMLGVLLCVVAFSVVLFEWALGLSTVDAFYFVVTIITTVGFGDFNLMNSTPGLKLYGALLMFCGAASLALLFSFAADFLLRARLRSAANWRYANFEGHILVAGLGNIGYRVARELAQRGETVVAIERNPEGKFAESAREWGAVIEGNARAEETLRRAGLAGAKAVLAVTDDDLANLGIGLAARRVSGKAQAVLRVYDSRLVGTAHGRLGVGTVLSVSALAAATFTAVALASDALQAFVLRDHLVVIFKRTGARSKAQGETSTAIGAGEVVLRVKKPGEVRFGPAAAGQIPGAEDELVGARWYPLKPEV